MIGGINLKKLDMRFGKSNRNKTSKNSLAGSVYLKPLVGAFFALLSCNNLEKSPNTVQIERLVLNKNDINNGYVSIDTLFIRRNKKEDSPLNPLVGVKSFWEDSYIYSSYYFSDDAGVIWVLPYNFFIDLRDKDILDNELIKEFLSKNFKLTLIFGINNEDYNLFIDEKTQIKINHGFRIEDRE